MSTKREQDGGELIVGPWESGAESARSFAERHQMNPLAVDIAEPLVAGRGSVVRLAASVEDIEEWRRAARRAGRALGVSVRTGVACDGLKVWVVAES